MSANPLQTPTPSPSTRPRPRIRTHPYSHGNDSCIFAKEVLPMDVFVVVEGGHRGAVWHEFLVTEHAFDLIRIVEEQHVRSSHQASHLDNAAVLTIQVQRYAVDFFDAEVPWLGIHRINVKPCAPRKNIALLTAIYF